MSPEVMLELQKCIDRGQSVDVICEMTGSPVFVRTLQLIQSPIGEHMCEVEVGVQPLLRESGSPRHATEWIQAIVRRLDEAIGARRIIIGIGGFSHAPAGELPLDFWQILK